MRRTPEVDWHDDVPLASAAARGGLAAVAGSATRFVVQLAGVVVTARLLGPGGYGFAAPVLLVTGLAELVRESGIAAFVARSRRLGPDVASALHRASCLLGVVGVVVGVLVAPTLARVTGHPDQAVSLAVLSLVFVGAGALAVPCALLTRNLRLRSLTTIELVAATAGVAATVGLTLAGAGPRALVAQGVVFFLVLTAGVALVNPWRPSRPCRWRDLRCSLAFAGDVGVVQIVTWAARSADRVVVAAVCGPAAAGLYAQASQLLLLPLEQVAAPLQRVAVPALARVTGDAERFRRWYRAVLGVVVLVLWPAYATLGVLAPSVVQVLFGSEWVASADVFRALVVAGLAQSLGYVSVWVFLATGRARAQAAWALVSRPLVLLASVVGVQWGVLGVAFATSASALALVVPAFVVAGRPCGLRLSDLVVPVLRPAAVATGAGTGAACAVLLLPPLPLVVTCCLAGGVAALVLLTCCRLVPGLWSTVAPLHELARKRSARAGVVAG